MRNAVLLALLAAAASAQQIRFEEASVKRADACRPYSSIDTGRVLLEAVPLKAVLMEAFGVKMDQITGPSWLEADCFSIVAKIPDGLKKDQLPAMLQSLLAERFKLVAHMESHAGGGYALLVDKGGPKFKESDLAAPGARPRGQVRFGFSSVAAGFKGSTTIAFLARYLSTKLGVPVQDLTGLDGTYDLDVSWSTEFQPERVGAAEPDPSATALPSLFTAVRESLGLRLESRKVQADVVVIDHIERVPTANQVLPSIRSLAFRPTGRPTRRQRRRLCEYIL